jgi:choline dehydrogenase
MAEKIADAIRGRAPLPRVEVPYYIANGAPSRR